MTPCPLYGRDRDGHAETTGLRTRHGFGVAPIADLQELIEAVSGNIMLAILPMPTGMDAMVVKDPIRERIVIGVATTDVPGRQRFSLAHELGHILHNDYLNEIPLDCSARTDSEGRADTFARHLLVPLEGVSNFIKEKAADRKLELRDLAMLTRHFNVSPRVIVYQLKLLGLVSSTQEEEFVRHSARSLSTRFGWLEEYKANAAESATPRPPRGLVERATEAYLQSLVGINALSKISGEKPEVYLAELEAAGITPEPHPVAEAVSDADFFGSDTL